MDGIPFVKGHGTENDFVLLPDLDATLELTPARVVALCDRRRGLGADGVLRVVRAKHIDASSDVDGVDDDGWFMDYRNADGSIAEMCGNGVRVFARYLVEARLAEPGEFTVGSRAGARQVVVHPDRTVTVDMGPATVLGPATATVAGVECSGLAVDVGNPHLVCPAPGGLAALDLTAAPVVDRQRFPHGVNVEFVKLAGPRRPNELVMRVHERGVGETRSCGTGTVAAVAAMRRLTSLAEGSVTVHVPGGSVQVTVTDDTSTLTGPAELVARGELDVGWWRAAGEG